MKKYILVALLMLSHVAYSGLSERIKEAQQRFIIRDTVQSVVVGVPITFLSYRALKVANKMVSENQAKQGLLKKSAPRIKQIAAFGAVWVTSAILVDGLTNGYLDYKKWC